MGFENKTSLLALRVLILIRACSDLLKSFKWIDRSQGCDYDDNNVDDDDTHTSVAKQIHQ